MKMRGLSTDAKREEKVVVCADFDQTISTHDTIYLLFEAATLRRTNQDDKKKHQQAVDCLVNQYISEMKQFMATVADLNTEAKVFDREGLERFLDQFSAVDMSSIQRVIESRALRGVHETDLLALGAKIEIMDGCLDVLSRAAHVCVVSSNWSALMIEHKLRTSSETAGCLQHLQIVSNDLDVETTGVTSGSITLRMQSPSDKATWVRKMQAQKGRPTVYIGDSTNDLLALLEADVGIIVTKELRGTLKWVCQRFGIDVVSITECGSFQECTMRANKHTRENSRMLLFTASDWSQISNII
ncbi:hypothetical protein Poli38472_002561 [Pythium oligandrum]|uniref:Uncharacterized protein n=1 Tax=Pythium oligandrum TaxID=41045 RepID=A0A8K1CJ23_PYTOL|nr:hypothetical protein Poli38472_002561 [Pythium oligandrum]|eukprot:TMW63620.1 hypothetical protein Poli38472_002561 [Pythium oligandrum]